MLSLEKCKQILNCNSKLKDDEVKRIRDLLYNLAYLDLENYKKKKNENRNNLHKGIN